MWLYAQGCLNRDNEVLSDETTGEILRHGHSIGCSLLFAVAIHVYPLIIVGSLSYLIGLKPVFRFKIWDFFPCETQKIILQQVKFNPRKVRWTTEKLTKLEKLWKLKFWNFISFLMLLLNLVYVRGDSTHTRSDWHQVKFNESPKWLFAPWFWFFRTVSTL